MHLQLIIQKLRIESFDLMVKSNYCFIFVLKSLNTWGVRDLDWGTLKQNCLISKMKAKSLICCSTLCQIGDEVIALHWTDWGGSSPTPQSQRPKSSTLTNASTDERDACKLSSFITYELKSKNTRCIVKCCHLVGLSKHTRYSEMHGLNGQTTCF